MNPLKAYLEKNELSHQEFAAIIGVKRHTVTKLCAEPGKGCFRRPTWPQMRAIARATSGEVTPNDFVEADGPQHIKRRRPTKKPTRRPGSQEGPKAAA